MKFFEKLKEHFFKAFEDDMPTIEFVNYTGEWPCLCSGTLTIKVDGKEYEIDPATGETKTKVTVTYAYDDVTKNLEDIYEMGFTNDPWKKLGIAREKKMPTGTAMVPRVIKTNVGDIMTTNTIAATTLKIGDILAPNASGILSKSGDKAAMTWQVVKVYTLPDHQKAVKVMRIA